MPLTAAPVSSRSSLNLATFMAGGSTTKNLPGLATRQAAPRFPTCLFSRQEQTEKQKRRTMKNKTQLVSLFAAVSSAALLSVTPLKAIDLLERYPTQLTAGDTTPAHAKPWEFT